MLLVNVFVVYSAGRITMLCLGPRIDAAVCKIVKYVRSN